MGPPADLLRRSKEDHSAPTHHCAKQSRSRPGPRRVMKTFAMAALILLAFFAELGTLGEAHFPRYRKTWTPRLPQVKLALARPSGVSQSAFARCPPTMTFVIGTALVLEKSTQSLGIKKAPSGIPGLDEVTLGGLPAGRPTLICGSAGCGKTLLAVTFLYKGATDYGEPGVFMTFEERPDDLVKNVASLHYGLDELVSDKKLLIDHVHVDRNQVEETGEYDLEGLFIRLGYAIDTIGAKRVVLDTIETLFGGLSNVAVLRSELRRLFEWLKDKGVTAIVTGERGEGQLTRQGLEEYVSDCVILLDNRIHDQLSTRRMRIVKYRGSAHGTNEYPFLIDEHGISVMPISAASLDHDVSEERISSGVNDLDVMLGAGGYFKGSSVLISGMSGTGKSSLAAHFADSLCREGKRCLYFALEESPRQIVRNMRSIGLDLQPHIDKGLLLFCANRPSLYGLEMHLATMHREVESFTPAAVIIDPLSSLCAAGGLGDVHAMSLRLIDFLKSKCITALIINLTHGNIETAMTEIQISSLIDTWVLLYNKESDGEHNRELYLLKSRGMAHSNQVREFLITDQGIVLREPFLGPNGIVTGSARVAQEARDKAAASQQQIDFEHRQRQLERKRRQIRAQVEALQIELAEEEDELVRMQAEMQSRLKQSEVARDSMADSRKVVKRPSANVKSGERGDHD
jgi:circadian clock protein KaiC